MKSAFKLAAVTLAFTSSMAFANDIQYFTTVTNTDWTEAGLGGMRGVGTGDITLSGVSGSISQAYLFWHGPTNSTDPSVNAAVNFNGTAITGTNIGFSSDNNWGFDNSQAYRANVTSLVSGNGTYSLSDFTKGTAADVNGASLIVFYNDGNAANNRDVVLFDGNDSNAPNTYDANGWNVSLPGINYTGGSAAVTMTVSDGQTFDDDALKINGNTVAGPGAVFNGDSTPRSTGGVSNGSLWDVKTFDATSFLSLGTNTLSVTTGVDSDYLSLIVAAIDLPAGDAPPPPISTIPEPGNIALLLAGIGMIGAVSRRRRAS